MSYILDALKRAESERSRGGVPTVHAQSVPVGGSEGETSSSGLLIWAAVVSLLVVLAAAVWWWSSDKPALPVDVVTTSPSPQPSSSSPAPALIVLPTPREPVATARAAPSSPLAFKPMPSEAVSTPPSKTAAAQPLPPRAERSPKGAGVAASVPAAEQRVYALKDLPNEIRSSLPTVAVGGASYSENPSSRMLIINGQIYHEGDRLAPDLTLQQIQLRTAVLSFRGYRYAISY